MDEPPLPGSVLVREVVHPTLAEITRSPARWGRISD
jgi:hypothetical protein